MPALDIIHQAVKNALIKDGWEITDDPYIIRYGSDTIYIDLAAERRLAAERNGVKIAIEIESFLGRSQLQNFEVALGQYILYLSVLAQVEPSRKLYLALGQDVYAQLFRRPMVSLAAERYQLALLIVDLKIEEVKEWIN